MMLAKGFKAIAFAALLGISYASWSQDRLDEFVVEKVFAGRSVGHGSLRLGLGKARPFTVESSGAVQADGSFRLEQSVRFEGKPARSRHWIMRRTEAGQYAITLSDAAGPVTARVEGQRMLLRIPLNRSGLVMHQTLELVADGKTLANDGCIRFLGIPVGRLRETIELHR